MSEPIVVTTNNIMSLPVNPHVTKTLNATPRSSVLLVQEADLDQFKLAIDNLHDYDHGGSLHVGDDTFDSFVLFKPDVWEHVRTVFHKLYDGAHGISKTRHICVTVLRHRPTGVEYLFLSWHAVTKGNDRTRRAMRREGLAEVRKIIRRHKGRMPIITGADTNATGNPHPTSTLHTHHGIDHQNAWNGGGIRLGRSATLVVKTSSDHDALAVTYAASVK